jgi:hypothetical protein
MTPKKGTRTVLILELDLYKERGQSGDVDEKNSHLPRDRLKVEVRRRVRRWQLKVVNSGSCTRKMLRGRRVSLLRSRPGTGLGMPTIERARIGLDISTEEQERAPIHVFFRIGNLQQTNHMVALETTSLSLIMFLSCSRVKDWQKPWSCLRWPRSQNSGGRCPGGRIKSFSDATAAFASASKFAS